MLRKNLSILVLIIILSLTITPVHAQEYDPVKVTVDGRLLEFDVPPTLVSGRTLVKSKLVCKFLGTS